MFIKRVAVISGIVVAVFCAVRVEAAVCQKQTSRTSIEWITNRYKNCVNCDSQTDKNGLTIYYCYCGDKCNVLSLQKKDVSKKIKSQKSQKISSVQTTSRDPKKLLAQAQALYTQADKYEKLGDKSKANLYRRSAQKYEKQARE